LIATFGGETLFPGKIRRQVQCFFALLENLAIKAKLSPSVGKRGVDSNVCRISSGSFFKQILGRKRIINAKLVKAFRIETGSIRGSGERSADFAGVVRREIGSTE